MPCVCGFCGRSRFKAGALTCGCLVQGILGPASPIPTQCVLLKNMFDPAECVR